VAFPALFTLSLPWCLPGFAHEAEVRGDSVFGSRAERRASTNGAQARGRNVRGSNVPHGRPAPLEPETAQRAMTADNATQALSFDAVVAEHGPYVWRVLRRLGVRSADVEDVWQETFIVVHRKLGGFEGRSQLRTWLSAIAVRVASDYRSRAYRRREQATDEVPDAGAQASQQDDLMDQERRALLDRLMAELKPEQREVVVLYEFAELPMQEVAEALGCPLQTAYSRLHAGRKALEQAARREAARKGAR
jgi:RNA polymerase sigma-70 factor, ECF subfamily